MAKKKQTKAAPATASFSYSKSNYFRTVSVDGVSGGITPRGYFHMAAWSQRAPQPDRVTHELGPGGELGQEISREGDNAIARELEVGLVFDAPIAKAMIGWLEERLEQLEALAAAAKDNKQEEGQR